MIRFQCQQCRREIEVDEALAGQAAACPQCGAAVVGPVSTVATLAAAAPVSAETTRTSGWAIASFVCGLTGCLGVTAILAVIFGIIAIREIDRSQARLKGKGMAVAGIVLGALLLLASTAMTALSLYRWFSFEGR